jgi:polyhydroxybutyrate depolymerase
VSSDSRVRGLFRSAIDSLLLAGLLIATAPAHVREPQAQTLSVSGVERSYLVFAPSASGVHPAVIVLHGGSLDAQNTMRSTGFEPLVERAGFMAVYPDALGGHWNDGRGGTWRGKSDADDVAFLLALIVQLERAGLADARRVYVTGPSNGGMMTFRLICEAAEVFAAAAPIIACLPADLTPRCAPHRPLLVVVMNGTADPLVPYGGGEVRFRGERGRVLSTDDTIVFLRKANGCSSEARIERLADLDPNDGLTVTVASFGNCSSAAPVVLYRIEGGGHRIPRLNEPARPVIDRLFGKPNRDFEAAEALWTFFKEKQRCPSGSTVANAWSEIFLSAIIRLAQALGEGRRRLELMPEQA